MRVAYTGTEALTFSQYIDGETGRTLHAEPGGVYDILPASGHSVPEIPAGWFIPVEAPAAQVWAAEPDAVPEPEPVPEPAPEAEQDNPEG